MTWLYILIAVFLLLFLILFSNVKVTTKYEEALSLEIKYLFLKFKFPSEKEKKKKKEKPKKETQKKKGDSLFKKHGVSGFIELLKDILEFVNKHFKKLKHLVVSDLSVDVIASGEDAGKTALIYAELCGVIYPLVSGILGILKYKKYNVSVTPDFNGKEIKASGYAVLEMRVIFLICLVLGLGVDGIKLYLNLRKGKYNKKEDGAENDRTSD